METNARVAAEAQEGNNIEAAAMQPTSLRYLRLKNDFRSMIQSGMDCMDEQVRFRLCGASCLLKQLLVGAIASGNCGIQCRSCLK